MRYEIALVLVIILAFSAYAATEGAETDRIGTGKLQETTAGSTEAEGGNVTLLNLTTTQSTARWQGFYGNVSGSLSLGLGSDVLYDFSSATISSVFASMNQTFDFTVLQAATTNQIDTVWGYGSGADIAANIFTGITTVEGVAGPSVELEPIDSDFNTTIFNDGSSSVKESFAFGVTVQEPAVPCFDSSDCEYELMVPATTGEVYYFFLSI